MNSTAYSGVRFQKQCGWNKRRSAFALILVLALLAIFSVFTAVATMFLRPAAMNLDLHHECCRAQLLAESALQEALACEGTGAPLAFEKPLGTSPDEMVKATVEHRDGTELLLLASGRLRVLDGTRQLWTGTEIRAQLRKNSAGFWEVVEYCPTQLPRGQQ